MEKDRVPFFQWTCLAVILGLVWILGAEVANSAERGDRGFITASTHLCHTTDITPLTIEGLYQWGALIERLEAAGGAIFLSEEDNDLGSTLSRWCSTLSEGYPVVLFRVDGDHALAVWDTSLGFGTGPFIIKLSDFQAGGLRL